MRILIVIPVSLESTRGNRITGSRWQQMLAALGHEVQLHSSSNRGELKLFFDNGFDCVIFLHATRSHSALTEISRHRKSSKQPLLVVCMTGTDLHCDYAPDSDDLDSERTTEIVTQVWQAVDKIVLLEPKGQGRIPDQFQDKCSVIFQSALPLQDPATPSDDTFRVCVIGHLRPIKDPMRTAIAARKLPAESKTQVVQIGAALSPDMQQLAEQEMQKNDRYQWLGELTHQQSMYQMTACQLMVLSSINEGAPSVLGEAIVNRVPVLASRIDASIGMLGADYPGFFDVGDTDALTRLLVRAESDPTFMTELNQACAALVERFDPATEQAALQKLVETM